MQDHDLVIANDSAASRIPALRTVLQTWGANNFAVTNFPGENWGDWYPETFDRILLDAPCSMQSLRVSASHPHRPITEDERSRLATRQLALLLSAAKALKTGGELVYSTCTLSPEEDEAVVSALLETCPGIFEIDPTHADLYQAHGLTEFDGNVYHPMLKNSLRIWPFIFQTNGFFAVKLTKTAPIPVDGNTRPKPPSRPTKLKELSYNIQEQLFEYFEQNFAFNLENLLEEKNLALYWWGEKIWIQPKKFFEVFTTLPVQLVGIQIGQFIRQNFEPSPDFILSYGQHFDKGYWLIPEEETENWMKGYDIRGIKIPALKTGSFLQIRDSEGNNLGAGKYSKERLRNLLPNRHLIR
jgi:16S rRNA (cytosine1407-C5)-methyltransferase